MKRAREIAALRERAEEDRRLRHEDIERFGKLTSQYVDLMMFAEAFAEELEGRRGQGRPIAEILAEYREAHPFDA